MKLLVLVVTIASLLGLGMIAPASAHDAPRRCGDRDQLGAGWWDAYAHNGASCATARRVAEKWHDRVMSWRDPDRFRVNERVWRCRDRDLAGYAEAVRVRCARRDGAVVHFLWGA